MSAPGGLVVGGTPLTPREAQPLAATVAPVGASCARCLLRPPSALPFGGQRRTFRSTVWPRRHSFGDQRRTCRSTVWLDRPPPRGWRSQPLCPRSTLQLPIIGVSKPSHQPIRNETFRIGNSRRLLIKRAFEEVGTRRKKGKGVNPPSGTRRGRPRNDATAEAERFSLRRSTAGRQVRGVLRGVQRRKVSRCDDFLLFVRPFRPQGGSY